MVTFEALEFFYNKIKCDFAKGHTPVAEEYCRLECKMPCSQF